MLEERQIEGLYAIAETTWCTICWKRGKLKAYML